MLATVYLGSFLVWLLIICSTSHVVDGRSSPPDTSKIQHQQPNSLDNKGFERDPEHLHSKKTSYERNELVKIKSQLGSRPPKCQSKCNSCQPCEAVQVPAVPQSRKISRGAAAGTQEYSNYKPMSWKCRCGDKLFNP